MSKVTTLRGQTRVVAIQKCQVNAYSIRHTKCLGFRATNGKELEKRLEGHSVTKAGEEGWLTTENLQDRVKVLPEFKIKVKGNQRIKR